jgi:hypothetical protein
MNWNLFIGAEKTQHEFNEVMITHGCAKCNEKLWF